MNSLHDADARIENDRKEIDDLDAAIIDLLRRRADVSRRIQQQRMSGGGPRMVLKREMAVIHRYGAELGSPGTTIAMKILELCRGADGRPAAAPASEPARVSGQQAG